MSVILDVSPSPASPPAALTNELALRRAIEAIEEVGEDRSRRSEVEEERLPWSGMDSAAPTSMAGSSSEMGVESIV